MIHISHLVAYFPNGHHFEICPGFKSHTELPTDTEGKPSGNLCYYQQGSGIGPRDMPLQLYAYSQPLDSPVANTLTTMRSVARLWGRGG